MRSRSNRVKLLAVLNVMGIVYIILIMNDYIDMSSSGVALPILMGIAVLDILEMSWKD